MSPCLAAGGQNLRNPAYVSAATRRAEKVLHFSGTERKVYKSNSCVARRWPVLHLANEKSVPFDVAPTRAWWESLLYRPLLHPSPFTERGPSSPAQASPSCPLLRYGDRALFLHSGDTFFYISHFTNFSDEVGSVRKPIGLDPLIVFGSFLFFKFDSRSRSLRNRA